MDNSAPTIEVISTSHHGFQSRSWFYSRRLIIFIVLFLTFSFLSIFYVYSRPALFQTHATLLTVAQTAIDKQSSEADIQHVAIQSQVLLGQELLAATLEQLNKTNTMAGTEAISTESISLTPSELRQIFSVKEIPDTNLVELVATGYQAERLAPLINTWLDVYLKKRAEEIRQTTGVTIDALTEELKGLDYKILLKRSELEQFRKAHNITSLSRQNIFENQSLAKFKALNESVNDASEEVVITKARLDAIRKAIAEGKMVVPDEDKRGMRVLELRLQELQEQLADFDRKYTRSYLKLQPNLNTLPEKIKALKAEIQSKRKYGQSIVLSDAEQNFDAAKQTLTEIKAQLEQHKQQATEFSSRFAEHESLLTDLEGLETLHRTTKERLVQIEARQAEKFPQVKVIERAYKPKDPISPAYTRDAIIALSGSLLFSFLGVWLIEFLTHQEKQKSYVSIPGISVVNEPRASLIHNQNVIPDSISQSKQKTLQHNIDASEGLPRELSDDEMLKLLKGCDLKIRRVIALLLCGLTVDEVLHLTSEQIQLDKNVIELNGEHPRTVQLPQSVKNLLDQNETTPAWSLDETISDVKLKDLLVLAAIDAALDEPEKVSPESIRHTYIVFLVKQGVRLSELNQILGKIEPSVLLNYSQFMPEMRGIPLSEINLQYPALIKL
jgi:uncharacterized protein involved in exopolysaccharide biosynthesis